MNGLMNLSGTGGSLLELPILIQTARTETAAQPQIQIKRKISHDGLGRNTHALILSSQHAKLCISQHTVNKR
jgi:hypothetical protein